MKTRKRTPLEIETLTIRTYRAAGYPTIGLTNPDVRASAAALIRRLIASGFDPLDSIHQGMTAEQRVIVGCLARALRSVCK